MLETIIMPSDTNFLLSLPQQFVGKKIKILMYSVDEIIEPDVIEKPKKAAQFRGLFTKEEGILFNNYLNDSRKEWERNI
jgi:hypothetical protein